ncbi:MAG: DUF4344 domain-containing metallopeptidase [Lysobacter sp.]
MRNHRPAFNPMFRIACAALLTLSLAACDIEGTTVKSSPQDNTSQQGDAAPQDTSQSGRFIAVYGRTTRAGTRREAELWQERKLLEDFVDAMNDYVRIPRDVKVIAKECGEANAFYDADTHSIEMCYELSAEERKLFAAAGDSGEALDQELYESAVGTLYHELGHALIGELELKTTGKEEDVADQMAAYILTGDKDSRGYLITVADTYALTAEQETSLDDLPFYDIHSLDAQRAINFLCYAYGSDPKAFKYLIKDGSLPKERSEFCEYEYAQLTDAWTALLEPYLKPE